MFCSNLRYFKISGHLKDTKVENHCFRMKITLQTDLDRFVCGIMPAERLSNDKCIALYWSRKIQIEGYRNNDTVEIIRYTTVPSTEPE